jgi:hypothetical protein
MGSGSKFLEDFADFFERLEGVPWRACPTRLPALSEAMGREQKGLTALSFLKTAPPPQAGKVAEAPSPNKKSRGLSASGLFGFQRSARDRTRT